MSTLMELKEATAAATPVLCFTFRFWDGHEEHVGTHAVNVGGVAYAKRVLSQDLHDDSLGSDDAISYYSRLSVSLSNVDGLMTQVEEAHGFRGATVEALLVFVDMSSGEAQCDPVPVFRGIADAPSLIDEMRVTVRAESRFSLFHSKLPKTPIQRRCPWHFPADASERAEAVSGGQQGPFSLLYRCGYSADQPGGCGDLNGGVAYSSCNGTRAHCAERGMLDMDGAGRSTKRFGGFTYLPPSIQVRTHGSRSLQASEVHVNHPRGNDVVPLVYGQGWVAPPLIHSTNDGNLTRMLYLLCDGEVDGVERVVVNGIEIPAAVQGRDMSGSGWHRLIATGAREGRMLPKPDNDGYFAEADPHGSMATLEVVIPNAMQKGSGQPSTEVLVKGLRLATFAADGNSAGKVHTDNPAWVLLDILLRSGWDAAEVDLASFARAASYCAELVQVTKWNGSTDYQPRFSCNLVLQNRRSVGELLRGIREGSFLYLREGISGKLEAVVEGGIAVQQAEKPATSNSLEALQGGWPAYEFGDGTNGRGGILRRADGAPSFGMRSKPLSECGNRVYVEFQDAWNEFQTDRISLFDSREIRRSRQELSQNSRALGVSTFPQAGRVLHCLLKRNSSGNRYVEFESGLRGIGVRPGDLITVTYPKYGLDRQLFRVLRVSPGENLMTRRIVAQWHEDSWYSDGVLDEIGGVDSYRNPGAKYGIPRPLLGSLVQVHGGTNFAVEEGAQVVSDGKYRITFRAGFIEPTNKIAAELAVPLSSLVATPVAGGGTLPAGETLYYRFTSVGVDGAESAASKAVKASLPAGGGGYGVNIATVVAPASATAIRVYRGTSPDSVLRIAELGTGSGAFNDTGLPYEAMVPPDSNFDHANFYWRQEILPATSASFADGSNIGNAGADWLADEFQGKLVWIASGKGAGQERTIRSNNSNTLFVDAWTVVPDVTSSFAIAEPTWHLAGKSKGSPAEFEVPNIAGAVVQILGVAANALDGESAIDRGTITRWQIGGGGINGVDLDVPPIPFFALASDGAGEAVLSGIGFETLENTRSVQSGTLEVLYYDELQDRPTAGLAAGVDAVAQMFVFDEDPGLSEGDYFQLDREILRVAAVPGANTLSVERGQYGTQPQACVAGEHPYRLSRRGMVFAVPLRFFGSSASGTFRQSFYLPHVRVAAAELWFTNAIGDSPRRIQGYTLLAERGLRTGYGGQYSLYVEGYLAIEDDAAIPLIVDRDHSVRDVFATVESPPTGGDVVVDVTVDGAVFCSLTIPQNADFSNTVSGAELAPIRGGSRLGVNVSSVVHYGGTLPGRDLSVRIRL